MRAIKPLKSLPREVMETSLLESFQNRQSNGKCTAGSNPVPAGSGHDDLIVFFLSLISTFCEIVLQLRNKIFFTKTVCLQRFHLKHNFERIIRIQKFGQSFIFSLLTWVSDCCNLGISFELWFPLI